MGRMKDIYMEVVQENGLLPENFSLTEYLHKKEIENAEWEEHEKNMQSKKETSIGEYDQNGDSVQSSVQNTEDKNKDC